MTSPRADPSTVLARIADAQDRPRWVVLDPGQRVHELPEGTGLGRLLASSAEDRTRVIETAAATAGSPAPFSLLAPVDDDTEVWAAGVTYETSRQARISESQDSDVYARVYDAERPELFYKAVGWRVVGPGRPISVREDSRWDVPEPELALVLDATGGVAGYTVCNDVSSRSIEGENPLYLPQAKLFQGCCAVGPWIVPVGAVTDPYDLGIRAQISRGPEKIWEGNTSTAQLHRRLDELAAYLFRSEVFPRGALLSTGTCIVPDQDVTLEPGDIVTIEIQGVGTLTNPVTRGIVRR